MRVVVTGGTGFIGRHLLGALASRHELICLARNPDGLASQEGVQVIEGDLADPQTFSRLPSRVDAVVHLAQANVPFPDAANELFAVNVASTQYLADYAYRAGALRFVYASSGNVYAPSANVLYEDSPCYPQGMYALTKYASESILDCYTDYFDVCILRLFVPYGLRQVDRLIPNIITRVSEGRPITVTNGGEPWVKPIYISDVVEVFVQSLALTGCHVLNVAGPVAVSIKNIAELAGAAFGRPPIFEHRSEPEHYNLLASTERLEAVLDLERRVTPAEGVARVVGAMKESSLLGEDCP